MYRQVTVVMVVKPVEWPSMSQINQGYYLSIGQPTIVQQPPIQLEAMQPPTIQPTAVQQPPIDLGAMHPPTLQHPRGGRGVSQVTL